MHNIFWIVLSILLGELVYLFSYLLSFLIFFTISIPIVRMVNRRLPKLNTIFLGLLSGFISGYITLLVLLLIRKHAEIQSNWYIVLIFFIIFYGELQLWGHFLGAPSYKIVGWPGRLNYALKSAIQNSQFAYYKEILKLNTAEYPSLEQQAYNLTNIYLMNLLLFSFIGSIIGLITCYKYF